MVVRSRMSREAHVRSLWGAGGESPPAYPAVLQAESHFLGTVCHESDFPAAKRLAPIPIRDSDGLARLPEAPQVGYQPHHVGFES